MLSFVPNGAAISCFNAGNRDIGVQALFGPCTSLDRPRKYAVEVRRHTSFTVDSERTFLHEPLVYASFTSGREQDRWNATSRDRNTNPNVRRRPGDVAIRAKNSVPEDLDDDDDEEDEEGDAELDFSESETEKKPRSIIRTLTTARIGSQDVCDWLISIGRVRINDSVCNSRVTMVQPTDKVYVNGELIGGSADDEAEEEEEVVEEGGFPVSERPRKWDWSIDGGFLYRKLYGKDRRLPRGSPRQWNRPPTQ